MYCRSVLLLLSFFVAVVTSQNTSQACTDAVTAVVVNHPCSIAFLNIRNALSQSGTTIRMADLNAFCVADCRNLVNRVFTCDNDPGGAAAVSLNQFICSIDSDGMRCYDFLFSARFATLHNGLDAMCPDDIPDGQMCSSACQTAFQNFAIDGGCCVAELLEFGRQLADDKLNKLLAQCPVDLTRGGTCTEIGGGATGLNKAFESILLFAVIFAAAMF